MRAVRTIAAGLVLALVSTAAARAVEDPLEPPDLGRYLRWGPFRVRPGLQLTDVGYDNNIFYRNTDRQGDYTAVIAPRAEGVVLFGHRAFVTFDEQLRYRTYAKFTRFNYLDQIGRARLTVPLGRIGVFGEVRLDRTHDRPADREDIRTLRKLDRGTFGILFRAGARTLVEIAHVRSDFRHSDPDNLSGGVPVSAILDRVESGETVDATWEARGRTALTLSASRRAIAFDTPSLTGDPADRRDATVRRLLPGVRLGLGGALTGSIELGPARLDYDSPGLRDYSGVVGEATLAYRVGRTTVRLIGERAVDFSVYEQNNYYVYDRGRLEGVRYLNRLVGLEAAYERGRLTVPATARSDRLSSYVAGVRLRFSENDLGRRVEYALRFTHYARTSTVPSFDRDQNVFGVAAIVGY